MNTLTVGRSVERLREVMKRIQMRRALSPVERALETQMTAAFHKQGIIAVRKLATYRDRFTEAIGTDETDAMLLLAFESTADDMVDAVASAAGRSSVAAFAHRSGEFGIALSFDITNQRAIDYLRTYAANRVTGINTTTRNEIRALLVRGQQTGWGYDRTAREISSRFSDFAVGSPARHIQSRAHLVAVTETADAYETANRMAVGEMRAAGLDVEKIWRNTGDDRVSDGCAANSADGWIDFDAAHTSGHANPPRFPGCRCWEEYRRKVKG